MAEDRGTAGGRGTAGSYWMHTTPATGYPALAGEIDVDVAVVGGGIAGLCAAWELARAGRSVAVLEAGRIAASVTGHTTAKLTAQHGLIYAHLRDRLGPRAAAWYARSQSAALARVAEVVAELGIDCDLERRAAYTYVTSAGQAGAVRAEARAAAAAGLPASLVTGTGLPFPVAAAVRVADQAQFHPRRYLLALAEDLTGRGGQIFERSRVVGLTEGRPCRLRTDRGARVAARDVVVATHYPVFDRAGLFTRLVPRRELVVAAPIDAAADPDGMYLTPEQHIRSVRTAPYADGQRLLIVTGEAARTGTPGAGARLDRLVGWAREQFPAAGPAAFRWAAQDNATADRVPYIGRFHPGTRHVWVATGFNGWGMSNGVLAGQLLAARMAGRPPAWAGLYDPCRLRPTLEAPRLLRANLSVARHFVQDRIRPATRADSPADLAPGTGAVLRVGGRRCAVYRDPGGALHAVSATCTHLGCVVAFSDAERAWECPCHGSRFDPDGAVLNGPATRPLPPRTVRADR